MSKKLIKRVVSYKNSKIGTLLRVDDGIYIVRAVIKESAYENGIFCKVLLEYQGDVIDDILDRLYNLEVISDVKIDPPSSSDLQKSIETIIKLDLEDGLLQEDDILESKKPGIEYIYRRMSRIRTDLLANVENEEFNSGERKIHVRELVKELDILMNLFQSHIFGGVENGS